MLYNVNTNVTTGFSQSDINSTCPCTTPPSFAASLKCNGVDLDGATCNALDVVDSDTAFGFPQGTHFVTPTYRVSVTWGGPNGGYGSQAEYAINSTTTYDVEIVPEGGDCNSPLADCRHNTNLKYGGYVFAPKAPHLMMRVRNYNSYCGMGGAWSKWYHFTVSGMTFASGNVYLDSTGMSVLSGDKCVSPNDKYPFNGLEIVSGPGLYGEYYNAYPPGTYPADQGGETINYVYNGPHSMNVLGGTPRTRWDTNIRFGQYHGYLNMPGTQDGPGWAARWTAKIRPSRSANYGFGTWHGGAWRVYINNQLLTSTWGSGGDIAASIYLTKGVTYDLRIEQYIISYNSAAVLYGPTFYLMSPNGATKVDPNMAVTAQDATSSGTFPVAADGTYTITNNLENGTISLNSGNYACSCPAGCAYSGVNEPVTNENFYVTPVGENWFQAMGGDLGAGLTGTGNLSSQISSYCITPDCTPAVLVPLTGMAASNNGAVLVGKNSQVDLSDQTGNQINQAGPAGGSHLVSLNSNLACKENYDYFYRLYSLGATPSDDFVAPSNSPDAAAKPTAAPAGGKSAYYHDGNLTINQPWVVGSGETIVIFVKGNLNITNSATITVPTNAFLSIIVSGDINIDSSIGTDTYTDTTGQVQGVYVANGHLTVASVGDGNKEHKFVGAGVFAACGGVSLPRDFRNGGGMEGVNNNHYPASLFVYRPDFLLHTPDKMKQPVMNWHEVAP